MEFFDKQFVYFMWDDILEGKQVFTSNYIDGLIELVNTDTIAAKTTAHSSIFDNNTFVYYDPNYEYKRAYAEGKQIQYKRYGSTEWINWSDCESVTWSEDLEFRIKPEECIRMSHREFAEWLARGFGECKSITSDVASTSWSYVEDNQDKEIYPEIVLRHWDDTIWVTPTKDIYKQDCNKK